MDGIVWLVCSWVIVGFLSYIFVTRSGSSNQIEENASTSRAVNEKDDWVNEIIAWLSTYKSFPIGLSEHWIKALNEVAKKICVPAQHEVIFEESEVLPNVTYHPKISKIESSRNSNGQLVVKAHLDVPATVVRVIASENANNYTTITNYDANVTQLVGEIEARLAYIADEVYLMVCFNNCPEMRITLTNIDKPNEIVEFNPRLDSTIRKCITSAVMSINFHEYVLSLREETVKRNEFDDNLLYNQNLASSLHNPSSNKINYDRSLFVYQPNQTQKQPSNKIRIKILRAQRLNFDDRPNLQPYVTVEIDEPAQKFTSTPSKSVNPHWDQNAEFNINELSDEILFEVYGLDDYKSSKNSKFLGLAIAGLSEMRTSNENVHNLQLQSRPYQNDRVSGILTIQSEFFYDPHLQSNNVKKKSTDRQYNKDMFAYNEPYPQKVQSKSTYDYLPNQYYDERAPVLDNVTNRGVDMTELVDRPHREPLVNQQAPQPVKQSTKQATKQISYQTSMYVSAEENNAPPRWLELENAQPIPTEDTEKPEENERGRSSRKSRSGKRERSFFGELRDRLTGGHFKTKKRAKSLDAQNPVLDEAVSEPPSRDQSQLRHGQISRGGTMDRSIARSSNRSPASDIPIAPSKLVLELGDDYQEKKYYFIPDYIEEQLRATRIMKRGKKLHVCNDHSFVAVKTKGSVSCDICGRRIATNFVKQAYQCRDCRLVTHKQCHRRTAQSPCPTSTLNEKFIVEDVNWEQLLSRFEDGEGEFISGENL